MPISEQSVVRVAASIAAIALPLIIATKVADVHASNGLAMTAGALDASSDSIRSLHPPGSRVLAVKRLEGGSVPPQLAVLWERGGPKEPRTWRFGLFIWQRESKSGRSSGWHLVYAHRSRRWPVDAKRPYAAEEAGLTVADLTRDGHGDALYGETMGTGVCGSFRVIATVRDKVREIFLYTGCNQRFWTKAGVLYQASPIYDGTNHPVRWRVRRLRWNGTKMSVISSRIVWRFP